MATPPPSPPVGNPTTHDIRVAELIKNKTTESTGYEKRDSELRTLMKLPGNYNKLTPMSKTEALRRSGAPRRWVNGFLGNGDKLNIMRHAQVSLRSAASGVNNYIRLCTMADSTASPPSTGTFHRRSTTLNIGKTFMLHINHLRKAAILLGRHDDWLTPEVRLIAKGLRSAQDDRFAFPNFIMTSDVARIILDQGWHSNMGMITYLPYL